MSRAAAILWVSRRDRAVVAGALAGIVALAWAYILLGAGMDTAMNMAMGDVMMPMPWTLATFRVMLLMWIVMMTAMMLPSAAPVFLLTGVYQLTPLKQACLRRCRSPLEFLSHYWQGGALGAFRMGLRHGLFCLGCCWAMMALLFVGGLMNVLWIAALALFVLAEKVVPG